ncbi:hypothetical protein L7F22_046347 [Adiantum nelumboides]|nr:hypothetical protein [Adiantum nelumboides]
MVYIGSSHVDTLQSKMELFSRKNSHIAEVAQALMAEKDMPNHFWAEAVNTSVYIMNRTPTVVVHGVTHEEKYSGKKPDLSHLKVFECIAYVHISDELHTKLDPKAEKCIFVGYSIEQKGYRCYNPSFCELRLSRDVVFDETASWYSDVKDNIVADVKEPVDTSSEKQDSLTLSGPRDSSSSGSIDMPWSGNLRMQATPQSAPQVSHKGQEKVGESPCATNVFAIFSHIDANFDGLA